MAQHFRFSLLGSPDHREPQSVSEPPAHKGPPPPGSLAEYLSLHHDELITLVEARRRPEHADQWEEI